MYLEDESRVARIDNQPVIVMSVIFITAIFVTVCILSALLYYRPQASAPAVQQDLPAQLPLTGPPAIQLASYLPITLAGPIILAGQVPAAVQIWEVTQITTLGYELAGQQYDLAAFIHRDSGATVQGYCINRGWDVPAVGTQYWLTGGDTFVPVQEPAGDPLQRFFMIQ